MSIKNSPGNIRPQSGVRAVDTKQHAPSWANLEICFTSWQMASWQTDSWQLAVASW